MGNDHASGAGGDAMSEQRILVTGASGFLGGRVVHRLAVLDEFSPIALTHGVSGPGAMRLARLPIDIVQGSICDSETMTDLCQDAEAVVNCAFGMGSTSRAGTETLANAALAGDIERFVHLSSASIHGHDFSGHLDEQAPIEPDTRYSQLKALEESILREFQRETSLEPTILRPFIVFGPDSEWVHQALQDARSRMVIPDGGHGTFNQVYVENLVDAILLALMRPDAPGETYLVSDPERVSWRTFYQDVAALDPSVPTVESMAVPEIRIRKSIQLIRDSVIPPARIPIRLLREPAVQSTVISELANTPWAEPLLKQLPDAVQSLLLERLNGSSSGGRTNDHAENGEPTIDRSFPSPRFRKMQTSQGTLSTHKIEDELGWEPRFDYETAMTQIRQWAEETHLVE